MDKTQVFHRIIDITTKQTRGDWWITLLQTYFNPQKILLYAGMIKILYPSIPSVPLVIGCVVFFLIKQIAIYFIGDIEKKIGLWEKWSRYNQTEPHMAPWNVEVTNTLKEICQKLNIKNKIV